MSLNIKININSNNNATVELIGEVDIYTSPELKSKLNEIVEIKKMNIIIECEKLEYIDSTGLGIFMSIYKKCQEANLAIKIVNLKPNIYKLFNITGLNKIFTIE